MSIKVMTWVWEHANAKGSELNVLLALADRANDSGLCWPGVDGIAEKCRLSPRQVRRIIHDLEADGLIAVKRNPGRSNTNYYRVLMGDTDVTFSPEDDREVNLTSMTENLTSATIKPDTDVTRYIKNHQEPSGSYTPEPKTEDPEPARDMPPSRSRFAEWYQAYPRKVAKGAAEAAWDKLAPSETLSQQIIEATVTQRHTVFKDADPKYIPHPATWLRQKRWEDDIPESGAVVARDSHTGGKDWYEEFLNTPEAPDDGPPLEGVPWGDDGIYVIDADFEEKHHD